jgi:hypothetical protein
VSDPLDGLREALATSPRTDEHLVFDPSGWTDAERASAHQMLLDAGDAGDHRVAAALAQVVAPEDLAAALDDLFARATDPGVRAMALRAMVERVGQRAAQLWPLLEQGQISDHSAALVIQTLLDAGRESQVRGLLTGGAAPNVARIAADRLWQHHGLHMYPTRPWTGLGLLKAFMDVPMASFQARAAAPLAAMLGQNPTLAGYPPCTDDISDALKAARRDLDGTSGPANAALIAPLSPSERDWLLAEAGRRALNLGARAVAYVGRLGGAAHQDLLEWAAQLPSPQMAQAGKTALAALTP